MTALIITMVDPHPTIDLFAEYSFGIRIQSLVDYLFVNHNIESEAIAYNQILFESERDASIAALIISSFDDVKIV